MDLTGVEAAYGSDLEDTEIYKTSIQLSSHLIQPRERHKLH